MTVLFSSNFDSYADAALVPGWVTSDTRAAGMLALLASNRGSQRAVSGTNIFGRNALYDAGCYTTTGSIGNQAMRSDAYASINGLIAHYLRSQVTTSTDNQYRLSWGITGGFLSVLIQKVVAGAITTLASFTTAISAPVVDTDIVHLESRATGTSSTVLEVRAWLNGATRPSTPTATYTDSTSPFTTGYTGLINLGNTGGWVGLDNLVITDAAGGEGTFDPVVPTAPGAPTIGTATAGLSSASVAGTAPASNGGAAITGYTAISTPGSITGTNATLPVTVAGLTPGTAYTFTLHATNSVGNSAESSASNSVTPYSVSGVTVSPATATVSGAATQQMSATVAGTASPPQGVTWSTNAGSINSSGLFTAPTATGSAQTVTITATSTADGTKSGTATITVPAATSTVSGVTVSPSTATVTGSATQAFSATVAGTGSPSQTVNWTTSAGSINSSGLLTAPAATGSAQTVTVTATSAQDGTKSGTATVTVPAAATGTLTIPPLVNNTGTPWASNTNVSVSVMTTAYPPSVLLTLTGRATDASGNLAAIVNAALVTGNSVRAIGKVDSGDEFMTVLTVT